MKLTLNGALDLSRSINGQSIWNTRSLEYVNGLAKDFKEESIDRLVLPPSPRSQRGRGNKNTGNLRRSIYTKKFKNTSSLRISEGFSLATDVDYAPFVHGKPIFRAFRPVLKTKPFFPPYHKGSSLDKWARRGKPKMSAFLVAKKISKRGLKMKPFIGGVVFENQKEIKKSNEETNLNKT